MRELELQRVGYLWRETSEQSQQEIERRDRIRMRLEHALASRTAFFASLSHEMRTPLHSILGFSDLVNLSSGNPLDVQTFSREVSLAAAKLQDTVDGVLSLSDVPRGGEATKNRFDAARVMADVMRLMGGFAFQRRVVLEAAGASNPCAVVGNSDALRHALLQICINAINASPAGGTVSMSVAATLLNTEISVRNTGPVLTGLECGQALTPLGQPCAAGGEGTGISLPIVRVLIERTGGTISLRGDADSGGTIATVSLLSSL
jgi:two-component system cell cycle sensor histidine kinase PleC